MKKLVMSLMTMMVLVGSLSACNTMRGMGQDVSAAGDTVSSSAQKSKPY